MPYDHSRKAGNRGDVWKHFVLVALADAIPHGAEGSKSFRYVESHAGAPFHALSDKGEWRRGIATIAGCDSRYTAIAREWLCARKYPAGWVFATARLARRFEHVEMTLFDTSDDVAQRYRRQIRAPANVGVKFRQQDGYPGAEDRSVPCADFVFLDPPYSPDSKKDRRRVVRACQDLAIRGVMFAAWYPVFASGPPQELCNSTGCAGWEVVWPKNGLSVPNYDIDRKPVQELKGCGMLVSSTLSDFLSKGNLRAFAADIGWRFSIRRPAGQ